MIGKNQEKDNKKSVVITLSGTRQDVSKKCNYRGTQERNRTGRMTNTQKEKAEKDDSE